MATSLLTTKLYIPPIRPDPSRELRARLVSRPRLIERLNAGLHRKLTLISAPAGFGKTTLVSAWIHSAGESTEHGVGSKQEQASDSPPTPYSLLPTPRFAWLSLDEGDNDPARFLAYLVAALQTLTQAGASVRSEVKGIEAHIEAGVLAALQSPQPPLTESVLTALINEIAALASPGDREGRPYILVLDDYHLVTAQPIHDGLTFLLDHLPPNLHLVVATRADPPLPIARLRGQGQLTELRQSDLRFTADEAAAFLNTLMGLNLSPGDIAALEARTEGWVAGLQMAALAIQARLSPAQLSMREQKDVAGFIRAFTGSDRHILDYLAEEVLQRQPEGIQTFLLQTSILDRLTGPLCSAVSRISESASQRTGESPTRPLADSQAILEYLEHNNLFVVPLDNERRWYRYHRLFADLLRSRLRRAHPDLVPILHRRAGEWFEGNGLTAPAIGHMLRAGDFERAAGLIEQIAEATLMRSELATFLGWVDALPDELVRDRPSLCVFQAWALLLAGRPLDAVEARLQDAARSPRMGKCTMGEGTTDGEIDDREGTADREIDDGKEPRMGKYTVGKCTIGPLSGREREKDIQFQEIRR